MREAFVEALEELAAKDPDITLLTGDLGFGVFENFQKRFPLQFYNVGIAEQCMIGLAAGLAMRGKKVFVYSIGNFPTLRCLEQIRNDLCYHGFDVTIVSQGGGFSYGGLGMSHHATEDLSIMRALPNISICAPSSRRAAYSATHALYHQGGVGYLRLEKAKMEGGDVPFVWGDAIQHSAEGKVAIVAIGGVLVEAIDAVKKLRKKGIAVQLLEVHTLKPFDTESLLALSRAVEEIVVLEENNTKGGLFGEVAELLVKHQSAPRVVSLALQDVYSSVVGEQSFLRKFHGIDSGSVVKEIETIVLSKR